MATDVEATTVGTTVKSRPGRKQFQALFDVITATVVLTESSIAAAKASQGSVTVPGAKVGDFVNATPASGISAFKGVVYATVSAADTVLVTVLNADSTDAMTDLSAGITFNVIVLSPKSWAQN